MPNDIPLPNLSPNPPTEPLAVLPGPQPESATEPEPKRRRKRKPKEPPASPETDDGKASPEDLERCALALQQTFSIGSAILAKRRGPHWQLTDEECQTLGGAWTAALAPYLPKIGAAVPWATAVIVTAMVILPRIEQDRALADVDAVPAAGPAIVP
jgi:hypothetical protein